MLFRVHPAESVSVATASNTRTPFNPQVRILAFPHQSMLLLSNQPSEAKAITSKGLRVFPINTTNEWYVYDER